MSLILCMISCIPIQNRQKDLYRRNSQKIRKSSAALHVKTMKPTTVLASTSYTLGTGLCQKQDKSDVRAVTYESGMLSTMERESTLRQKTKLWHFYCLCIPLPPPCFFLKQFQFAWNTKRFIRPRKEKGERIKICPIATFPACMDGPCVLK